MPKDISWTFFHTVFFALFAMLDAFLVVYLYHIVLQADCFGRTSFDTHLAGDAAYFAHSLHLLAKILGATGNPDPGISGNKFDQILRASAHAGSTTDTQIWVYDWKVIDHGDGGNGSIRERTLARGNGPGSGRSEGDGANGKTQHRPRGPGGHGTHPARGAALATAVADARVRCTLAGLFPFHCAPWLLCDLEQWGLVTDVSLHHAGQWSSARGRRE